MRRALALALALALAGATAALAQGATAPSTLTVPVTRCRTLFGTSGPRRPVPHRLAVHAPQPLSGLAAYTNTQVYLLGPAHLACRGIVAADGNQQLVLWPHGGREPRPHSRTPGLTLTLIPACAGCKAQAVCPYLRAVARGYGFPCRHGIPHGEIASRPRGGIVRFEDPAGVAGSGWPSGGPYLARGVVADARGAIFRATCTLPDAQAPICVRSIDDLLARYG